MSSIPTKIINPAGATGDEREALVGMLEQVGIDRLTIERGHETQTLRLQGEAWRLTCRNAPYA